MLSSSATKKSTYRSLIKKQQQQRLSKVTTEQTDFASYLRSTPILNRLRVRPDDHTAAVSSSSSTSPQPGLIAAKSKNK
ncbi:unnamed protein product [Rotaria sp. Silwood2]|nr:unnamed protein product [Rotaria sp. Silwood2]CAF3276090.1 unnamed protein product [Rotaria sp. Silwood2]CAF4134119.1 unnamed protein product [Rotaria sp. Silwood2]